MSVRKRKFETKTYFYHSTVHPSAVESVARYLRNRHYSVRVTLAGRNNEGYNDIWTDKLVKR